MTAPIPGDDPGDGGLSENFTHRRGAGRRGAGFRVFWQDTDLAGENGNLVRGPARIGRRHGPPETVPAVDFLYSLAWWIGAPRSGVLDSRRDSFLAWILLATAPGDRSRRNDKVRAGEDVDGFEYRELSLSWTPETDLVVKLLTPNSNNPRAAGLSHLSAFGRESDLPGRDIPLPATVWLFGPGPVGLGAIRCRRR